MQDSLPPADPPTATRYRFGAFAFDLAKRELQHDGAAVELPARVFECLEHLIAHRRRAVGRDELAQALFRRSDVSDGQLAQVVLRARRCVDDDGHRQRVIRTVPRYGYRWVAEVEAVHDDADAGGDAAVREAAPPATEAAQAHAATPSAAIAEPNAATSCAAAAEREAALLPAPSAELSRASQASPPVAPPSSATAGKAPRPGLRLAAVAAALLLPAALWLGWRALPAASGEAVPAVVPAPHGEAGATVLLPLRVDGADAPAWARLGLMDDLAERLRRAGLPVPPSESTLAFLGGSVPGSDRARLRRMLGAETIVEGDLRRDGAQWRVALAAEAGDGTRHRAEAVGRDPLTAARLAGDRLLAALGRTAPAAQMRTLDLDERLQRVKAALLANELEAARRILTAAPPQQLSQPQLRYRQVQVDYRAGEFAAAERTLDALLAGAEAAADPLFRARLLVYRGGIRVRRSALTEAEADFERALAALSGHDEAHLEYGAVLMGRAVVRSSLGRDAEAIADFGAARARLQRAGDRLGTARVDANLGALELGRGRPGQAVDYLESALPVFEQAAAMNELQVTRSALSAAHLQRLDPQAALAASARALRLLPRTRDPSLRLAAHLDHANALIALGRLAEARALLADPAVAARMPPPYEQRRAQTEVELAWRSGDAAAAAARADAALRDWPPQPGDGIRDWVRLRRAQAAQRADLPVDRDALSPPPSPTVPGLLAAAVARGEAAAAERDYRAALALAESRGAPAEIAAVAESYAPWLLRHGRRQQAAALVGRVAPWAGRCADCAALQRRLAEALGDRDPAAAAARAAIADGG